MIIAPKRLPEEEQIAALDGYAARMTEPASHDAQVRRAAFLLQYHAADHPDIAAALATLNAVSLPDRRVFDPSPWHRLEVAGMDVSGDVYGRPMPERRIDVERRQQAEATAREARRVRALEKDSEARGEIIGHLAGRLGIQPPSLADPRKIGR